MRIGATAILLALVVVAASAAMAPVSAPDAASAAPSTCPRSPVYEWMGRFKERRVTVEGQDGTVYDAIAMRPDYRDRYQGRQPAIVLMHGRGGGECGVLWAARDLAGHGYVTLALGAADPLGSPDHYADAVRAGVRFLRGDDNPFREHTRASAIGAAGHSQGSIAVAIAQQQGEPIDAIVAFDNLHRWELGDAGASGYCLRPRGELTPRVPAMGQAKDEPCNRAPQNTDPELKKTGYDHWRRAGIATMEVVIRDAVHSDWGAGGDDSPTAEPHRRVFAHYARAWFDRWLRGGKKAQQRLLAREVLGRPVDSVLSDRFRSAAFLPGRIDCEDLAGCL